METSNSVVGRSETICEVADNGLSRNKPKPVQELEMPWSGLTRKR